MGSIRTKSGRNELDDMNVIAGTTVGIRTRTEGLEDGIRDVITVLEAGRSVHVVTHRDWWSAQPGQMTHASWKGVAYETTDRLG